MSAWATGSEARAAAAARVLVVALVVSLTGLFMAGLSGCSGSGSVFSALAGTNDAALEYVVDPDPVTGKTLGAATTALGVKARLVAAQIPADVDVLNGRVRVIVDADVAGAVDALVEWRGGLAVYPAESVPGANLSSTRGAAPPPIVQLGVGTAAITAVEPVRRGKALALSLAPEARTALERERDLHPDERVALARGSGVIATVAIADVLAQPFVLSFGDGIGAYTSAYRNELLLRSPVLPPLRRVAAERLPPRWGLAAACAVLPFALSFAWLAFVRRFDRARPEPVWLVVATFALGGAAIVPAAVVELLLARLSPWLDPSLATLGGQLWALPLALVVYTVTVGAVEEGSKLLGAWSLATHRREFDEPVDGIVYGCAAALGFAAVENVKYFAFGRMSGVVIALRAFMTVPAHMFFGAIWGYALGRKLVSRRTSVLGFLALAALAHGSFDAVLATDGLQLVATLLVLVLGVTFVVLLRRALRHGAVPARARRAPTRSEEEPPPPTEPLPASMLPRAYHRVGSPAAFVTCAAAMIACAFALTVLGSAFELLHHRVGVVFVGLSTAMLALFGLAAWGTSATIPLDVAIDAQGVTFAGARTPWAAIVGFDVETRGARAVVRLHTPTSTVRLGPTRPDTAGAILASLRAAKN